MQVQLGQSATNCFAYSICCHNVLLVVCSNKWATELDELSGDDREWLLRNQVYVHVDQPLWQA